MNNTYTLITGAAKRVAKEIVIFLAERKHNIIIHYNTSKEEAEKLANLLTNTYKVKCLVLQANFNKEYDIKNLFNQLKEKKILVNNLINSASSFHFDDLNSYNNNNWEENFNTNLKAPYLLSREFVHYLNFTIKSQNIDTKDYGNIINIVDSWSYKIDSRFLSYNLAKLALWRLTQVMALELAPNIRVNGVAPGLTLKPDNMDENKFAEMYKYTPLSKASSPKDIAQAIWFILNTKSLCGEIIKVDCGKSLLSTQPIL